MASESFVQLCKQPRIEYVRGMRGLAGTITFLLISLLPDRVEAQELELEIQRGANGTFTLSRNDGLGEHTFIEFSTNGVWVPAYYASSNSFSGRFYTITNTGGTRLFRALQGESIASQVQASWERLGVTNYVFHFSRLCLCRPGFMVSGTVTVMSNAVVKVENPKDGFGDTIENPPLENAPTINQIFDSWVFAEPDGAYARQLEFDANGFPRVINIDIAPRHADDELLYTIESFTPLP